MRKAGSSRWKGVQQLTNEAPNQQAQSPLPAKRARLDATGALTKPTRW